MVQEINLNINGITQRAKTNSGKQNASHISRAQARKQNRTLQAEFRLSISYIGMRNQSLIVMNIAHY